MRKKLILIGVVVAVGILFYATRHRARDAGADMRGTSISVAPEFSLPTLTGEKLDLANYRGKIVLLDFWATWCEPCKAEIPHLVELQNKYRDQGLQVIGVSMDDEAAPVRDFYQQFKMNYPVVMGSAKTGELYGGVLGLPITFLIARDGRIVKKHIGATESAVFETEILSVLGKG